MPIQVEIPQLEVENALDAANHALAWFYAVKTVADVIANDDDWSEEHKAIAFGIIETLIEAQGMLKSVVDSGFDIEELMVI